MLTVSESISDIYIANEENVHFVTSSLRNYQWLTKKSFRVACVIYLLIGIGIIWGLFAFLSFNKESPFLIEDTTFTASCPTGFNSSPLLLIGLDGFANKYMHEFENYIPTISALKKHGAFIPLNPVYPTKTFPNLYSIVTGLYPESHGLIDNKMYDPIKNISFSLSSNEKFNPEWYLGEPIWITAIKQKIKSATFFWPGSDVNVSGYYPTKFMIYNESIPFSQRVQTVLSWLKENPSNRPNFITLYFHEPDFSGHRYGPNSQKVKNALKEVDLAIRDLLKGIYKQKLEKCINIIIVSDHGMENAKESHIVYLNSLVSVPLTVRSGAAPGIITNNGKELVDKLTCVSPNQPFIPFLKTRLPFRFHYENNNRIEPVSVYMRKSWQMTDKKGNLKHPNGGFHGSDNKFSEMKGILIGYGPGFSLYKSNDSVDNIEIYNLMCDLLNIKPSPNNGTEGVLSYLVKNRKTITQLNETVHPGTCYAYDDSQESEEQCLCEYHYEGTESYVDENLIKYHLPFGRPIVTQTIYNRYCLLYEHSYVSTHSRNYGAPMWTSFTLATEDYSDDLFYENARCYAVDYRVMYYKQLCSMYISGESDIGFLHPYSVLKTNAVPMSKRLKELWRIALTEIFKDYVFNNTEINVVVGPVYDNDKDGKYDRVKLITPYYTIPSYYFIILTGCKTKNYLSLCNSFTTKAYLLPNNDEDYNPWYCYGKLDKAKTYDILSIYSVRILDIEKLTGLLFFKDSKNVYDMLFLKSLVN